MPTVKVLYHSQCFDGFSSAAIFTRFYREQVDADARFVYRGLRHGAPDPVETSLFDGDVNAVLDFRYSPSPKLHWWFDHHRSAFVTPAEREHYEGAANPQHFWDPDEPSCAGYIARVLRSESGFDSEPLAELCHWADVIDAARFEDARTAIELRAPPLQLMSVLEQTGDGKMARKVIEALSQGELMTLAGSKLVRDRFGPIHAQQTRALELIRQASVVHEDIVLVDLSNQRVTANKFAAYYLHPEVTYVVALMRPPGKVRISVGANPWRSEARRHDIARICELFGGGGHAVVGGITIPGATEETGRRIAREIVELLKSHPPEHT